jgi:hypothetical protein
VGIKVALERSPTAWAQYAKLVFFGGERKSCQPYSPENITASFSDFEYVQGKYENQQHFLAVRRWNRFADCFLDFDFFARCCLRKTSEELS